MLILDCPYKKYIKNRITTLKTSDGIWSLYPITESVISWASRWKTGGIVGKIKVLERGAGMEGVCGRKLSIWEEEERFYLNMTQMITLVLSMDYITMQSGISFKMHACFSKYN